MFAFIGNDILTIVTTKIKTNKIAGILLSLFLFATTHSQTYKISWGDEVKMKKNTKDMDITAADKSGVYFTKVSRHKEYKVLV